MIAEHLERGGELAGGRGVLAARRPARARRVDADAAIAYFTRTLALERELGATPPTPTSRARRREALAGREEAHRLHGDLDARSGRPRRARAAVRRRARAARRRRDPARAAPAAARRLRAPRASRPSSPRTHAIAAGDDRLRGEALRVRGEILERLGRFDEALAVVGDARDAVRTASGAVTDEMAAMVGRGRIHLMRAHYEAARDAYRPGARADRRRPATRGSSASSRTTSR